MVSATNGRGGMKKVPMLDDAPGQIDEGQGRQYGMRTSILPPCSRNYEIPPYPQNAVVLLDVGGI